MVTKQADIALYKSVAIPCAYRPGLQASNLYANPYDPPDRKRYAHLIRLGFRRSGDLVYRPDCQHCQHCVSVRVKTIEFNPKRRFRRVLRKNSDLAVTVTTPGYSDEMFNLYRRYLQAHHAGGGMDNPSEEDFRQFLVSDWSDTLFMQVRLHGALIAVAVTDVVLDGLSSVYTFYEPDEAQRSLGSFAIMQQIALTRDRALPYLYLGYWVRDSRKMCYKTDFQPLQYYYQRQWLEHDVFAAREPDLI
ncbi:MAG TPA: arginyltransferase [Gammaproteobacteria bacterium]|jgi:arginine-tRNA-protein transferase|nr:arginyltransferase [Gammaproteobacteria bacterium]